MIDPRHALADRKPVVLPSSGTAKSDCGAFRVRPVRGDT